MFTIIEIIRIINVVRKTQRCNESSRLTQQCTERPNKTTWIIELHQIMKKSSITDSEYLDHLHVLTSYIQSNRISGCTVELG